MKRVLGLAAAAFLLTGTAAQATSLTTSSATFLANASGAIVETTGFGLPYYGPDDSNGNPTITSTNSVTLADGFSVTVSSNDVLAVGTGYSASAFPGYGGDVLFNNAASGTIGVDPRLSAFGFLLSPDLPLLAFGGGSVTATFTLSTGEFTTVNITDGNPVFFGFYGTAGITSVSVALSGTDAFGDAVSGYAFGDIYSVPEPASVALLGAGLSLIGLTRRRARA